MAFTRATYTFEFDGEPTALLDLFRQFYGPTMNAFESADKNGRADELLKELQALFTAQNKSTRAGHTSIPATYLRVEVAVP